MTEVSGSLKLVTGSPAAVSQVWLRAPNGRVQGSEYVTEAPDTIQVTGGAVSFDALPGAMVMTLVSHGSPMHTVKLLVPDKTTATLAECIEAAELATDGTRSALERLALEVQAELGQVPSLVSDALAQDSTVLDAVKQASVIREDTTVGTRVFAGNTMIYGDTGWRDLSSLLPSHMTGRILFRRQNDLVTLLFLFITGLTENLTLSIPNTTPGWAHYMEVAIAYARTTERQLFRAVGDNHTLYANGTDSTANGSATWMTNSPWPTSLPGTPS